MRKIACLTMTVMSLVLSVSMAAENRWNLYAGGSLSHLCEERWVGSDKSYGWGGGAFLGGGYEINFNSHWSLTPQLEFSYVNNGATVSSKEMSFYEKHSELLETWNLVIPVMASFRFPVSSYTGFRFGAGPFLQESLAGRQYKPFTDVKENKSGRFESRLNVGIMGEVVVETGSHFSYFFRTQYPFLKEGWVRKTITLSAGIKYTF